MSWLESYMLGGSCLTHPACCHYNAKAQKYLADEDSDLQFIRACANGRIFYWAVGVSSPLGDPSIHNFISLNALVADESSIIPFLSLLWK